MTRKNLIAAIIMIAVVLAAGLAFKTFRSEQARQRAELEAGLASARIVAERFERVSKIEVGRLVGSATVRSCYDGLIFDPCQATKAPFVTEYKLDLGTISRSAYRWDAETRTLSVDLPAVVPDKPIIDMGEADVKQEGAYISRVAGLHMQKQASIRLQAVTREASQKPEHIAKATENARRTVENLLRTPLEVAGLSNVRIVVRFPGETVPQGMPSERWDVSKSIDEVLAELR